MTTSTERPGRRATVIVFEGIDGSGKTTLSNAVAAALRAQGLTVEHVREGGTLSLLLGARGRQFLAEQLARHPDDLGLWRSAALAEVRGR